MGPRILIIGVNWLGDVLFMTPAIRAIRKNFQDSYLACLVPPRCRELLANNPYVNEVIVAPEDTSILSWPRLLGTALELRKKSFDRAILFHDSRTKAWVTALAGIPERIGPPPGLAGHKVDDFLGLLAGLGIPADGRAPDFFPRQEAEALARDLLQAHGVAKDEPYVVAHAGGNWHLKRWPVSHFIRWTELFLGEFGWKVVLCGTSGEKHLAEEIVSRLNGRRVISLCGETSLDTLAIILRQARLVLSNDSGPVHLAASQRTKIVAVFGPTSPDRTGPVSDGLVRILRKDVGCEVPCYFRDCDYRVCLDWITPEEVFENTKEMLAVK